MKRGYQTRDPLFNVYAMANSLPHGRLGLTVSKRVSARAVDRNRVRRQVRDAYRLSQGRLAGFDVVVMAKSAATQAGGPALRESLVQHWDQIARQCKRS